MAGPGLGTLKTGMSSDYYNSVNRANELKQWGGLTKLGGTGAKMLNATNVGDTLGLLGGGASAVGTLMDPSKSNLYKGLSVGRDAIGITKILGSSPMFSGIQSAIPGLKDLATSATNIGGISINNLQGLGGLASMGLGAYNLAHGDKSGAMDIGAGAMAMLPGAGWMGTTAMAVGRLTDMLASRGDVKDAKNTMKKLQSSYGVFGEITNALKNNDLRTALMTQTSAGPTVGELLRFVAQNAMSGNFLKDYLYDPQDYTHLLGYMDMLNIPMASSFKSGKIGSPTEFFRYTTQDKEGDLEDIYESGAPETWKPVLSSLNAAIAQAMPDIERPNFDASQWLDKQIQFHGWVPGSTSGLRGKRGEFTPEDLKQFIESRGYESPYSASRRYHEWAKQWYNAHGYGDLMEVQNKLGVGSPDEYWRKVWEEGRDPNQSTP